MLPGAASGSASSTTSPATASCSKSRVGRTHRPHRIEDSPERPWARVGGGRTDVQLRATSTVAGVLGGLRKEEQWLWPNTRAIGPHRRELANDPWSSPAHARRHRVPRALRAPAALRAATRHGGRGSDLHGCDYG